MKVQFSVVQYNTNETRTTELLDEDNARINRLIHQIFQFHDQQPSVMNLNEIQMDLKGVPAPEFQSMAKNLDRFTEIMSRSSVNAPQPYHQVFFPGNCGMKGRALPFADGRYLNEKNLPEEAAVQYGDSINCLATLPGQYSISALFVHQIVRIQMVSQLLWRTFNPDIKLDSYKDARGNPIPHDITLFDKGCAIVETDIEGRRVKFIVTHAIPAASFGQKNSPNIDRNRDQMGFIRWVATGDRSWYRFTDDSLLDDKDEVIKPISHNERLIILGDLNADDRDKNTPGSLHIKAIIEAPGFRGFPEDQSTDGPLKLDYLIWKNVKAEQLAVGKPSQDQPSDHLPIGGVFSFDVSE